jgi:hypothetical protein
VDKKDDIKIPTPTLAQPPTTETKMNENDDMKRALPVSDQHQLPSESTTTRTAATSVTAEEVVWDNNDERWLITPYYAMTLTSYLYHRRLIARVMDRDIPLTISEVIYITRHIAVAIKNYQARNIAHTRMYISMA